MKHWFPTIDMQEYAKDFGGRSGSLVLDLLLLLLRLRA